MSYACMDPKKKARLFQKLVERETDQGVDVVTNMWLVSMVKKNMWFVLLFQIGIIRIQWSTKVQLRCMDCVGKRINGNYKFVFSVFSSCLI